MPANATDYLDQTNLVTKLNALTGQTATPTSGVHGTPGWPLPPAGLEVLPPEQRTAEYLAQFLKQDVERWGKVIKAAGIAVD